MKAVEGVPVFIDKELLLFLHERIGRQYERERKVTNLAESAYARMPEETRNRVDEDLGETPRVTIIKIREALLMLEAAHELFKGAVKHITR